MFSIHLLGKILQRPAKLARKPGRTKTFHAREAVLTYLEELEDLHLAKNRLATPAKRWSHGDLEADVDVVRPGARHPTEAGRQRHEY